MARWIQCLVVATLFATFSLNHAHAVITFKVTKNVEAKQPIAIVPFGWPHGGQPIPIDIAQIVSDDLTRTGLFESVPFADLPSRPHQPAEIKFNDWRLIGIDSLVIGNIVPTADGEYTVEFRLYDVLRQQQSAGFRFAATAQSMRRIAHQIADRIYEKLIGVRGAFDTKIAYVTEERGTSSKIRYALIVADIDGHNDRVVVESTRPIMSPSWSPDAKKIAYVSFESGPGYPRIFIQDIATGEREPIDRFPGINGAPTFSPDGRYLAMTLSKDGNPEIYIMDLQRKQPLRRVTQNIAIDTEPSWSPDGKFLVFTSNRGGKPQIYRVAVEGGRPKRITFEGNYNARPIYSPDGTKLVLVHGDGNQFRIGLFDLENGVLETLTEPGLDESPSFAPNGSMILYATDDGVGSVLAAVSTNGKTHQQVVGRENGRSRGPAWSPFQRPLIE